IAGRARPGRRGGRLSRAAAAGVLPARRTDAEPGDDRRRDRALGTALRHDGKARRVGGGRPRAGTRADRLPAGQRGGLRTPRGRRQRRGHRRRDAPRPQLPARPPPVGRHDRARPRAGRARRARGRIPRGALPRSPAAPPPHVGGPPRPHYRRGFLRLRVVIDASRTVRPRRSHTVTLPPFQRVPDEHRDDVHRFLMASAGPNEADDAFQETFIAALRAYPRLRPDSNVRGWLLTIAHRKAVDAHRARGRRAVPVAEVDRGGSEDPALNGTTTGNAELWAR